MNKDFVEQMRVLGKRNRRVKVHIHFRKFSTERKIFRGSHAQYDFFFRSVYAPVHIVNKGNILQT